MNLTKLWDLQKELDRNILETHNLIENEELLQKKILALNVELGELANEWRGFKFWSNKEASPREVLLEEYVDCLHFTLSIGNQLGYRFNSLSFVVEEETLYVLRNSYNAISGISILPNEKTYKELLCFICKLGNSLGFKNDEIEEAYLSKNQKNHKRQEDGY